MKTIVITGGHHNSALVVAQELVKRGHKVVWIGHRHSSRGDIQDSAEYLEVTSAQIPFHDLLAGKLVFDLHELLRLPSGYYSARKILQKIRPHAILSFGGYLGGTVAIAGKVLGIPIYLHEQTITAGRANKLIGRLAKRIYLTWPESAQHFNSSKILVVGLPLRTSILSAKPKSLFTRKKPTLLVMGGKQGAHILNQFVFSHLTDLLTHVNVVHQTGTNSTTRDYERALALQDSLASLADCYLPLGYITESEIGTYLRSADYYFGRSGAHITYELAVLGLPALLVPLMSTHDQEQLKNAHVLSKANLGIVLAQSELTLPHFLTKLTQLKSLSGQTLALPKNSAPQLVDDLCQNI